MTKSLFGWYNQPAGTNTVLAPEATTIPTTDITNNPTFMDLIQKLAGAQQKEPPTFASQFSDVAQGVGSLASAWLGFKNLGLAKDQFKFSQNLAETNLANQANLTNQQLEGRYNVMANLDPERTRARYGSLGDYMAPRAVKGTL